MKRKRFGALFLAVTLTLSLIAPGTCPTVHAATVLETDTSTASDGCTMIGIYGSYYSNAKEALDKINEIRKEACNAGNVPDPRNLERMLTPSDYTPLKWSSDLERVARIRAAEAAIAYHFMDSGHDRLNEESFAGIVYNGHHSVAEDLSYYYNTDMIDGILSWYMEKKEWVNQDFSKTTGHYTSLINPKFTYIGLGLFYTEATPYPVTLAGELSSTSEQGLDETMLSAPKDVIQKIEVSDDLIKGSLLEGTTTIETDKTTTLTPMVQLQRRSTRKLWRLGTFTYSSSDTAVAKVANTGVVTGVSDGTATITVRSGNTVIASTKVTVKCAHPLKMTSSTPSTCQRTGEAVYYCSVCNKTTKQTLPLAAHDWDEGKYETRTRFVITCKQCKIRKVYNVKDDPSDPSRPEKINKKLVLNTSAGLKWVRSNTIDKYVKPELNKAVKSTYNSNTISWNKVKGAKGYQIYACKCDHKNNKTKLTLLATVKSDKTSYKVKNLKKNTFYEYKVVAYRKVDGKKVAIGKSLELHAVTASKSYKYSNPTSIKVKQKNKVVSSISVKVKKTAQLKSSPVMPKGKKLKGHTAKIRYISSKPSVASVNQKGKITGKKKGTCYVYAVGQNGITKKIKVKVK